jgi:type I restriction enzyme S subunit
MSTRAKIPLSDFITLQRGFDLPTARRKKGNVPVIASTGIAGYHNKAKVKGPGVVIGRSGSIGGGQYAADNFWPLNTTLWVKDFKGNNPRFTYYLLKGIDFTRFNAGAGVPTLNRNHIASLRVSNFSPVEQARIASILSTYDDLIENNCQRIQLLEESARLLYREWFVRLRSPGYEHVKIIDGVPEGWEKSTVSGLGKIVTGKTPSTKTPENFGGNIPFVKTPDMHRSRVIVETEEFLSERGANTQANKTLPVGSILVACIGARLGVVSITCKPCQTNQQINAVIPSHDHYRYYGLFALIDIKPRLEAIGGGATMPNVNKSKFASIPILIPSQILLQEFQEFASYTFQQIQLLHQQNVALTQARNLLLPRLMNGEIEV